MEIKHTKKSRISAIGMLVFDVFFAEILFVFLPISIGYLISAIIRKESVPFLISSEVALSIVFLLSNSLSMFIKLKNEYQLDSSSRVYNGIKLISASIIIAVINYCMILLKDDFPKIDILLIATIQTMLLLFSILMTLATEYAKHQYTLDNLNINKTINIYQLTIPLKNELQKTLNTLDSLSELQNSLSEITIKTTLSKTELSYVINSEIDDIKHLLNKVNVAIEDVDATKLHNLLMANNESEH